MKISFNIDAKREITEANFNFYSTPFVHPSRTLSDHDFIYMLDGEWEFGQGEETFSLSPDCLLILSGDVPHKGLGKCKKGTKTMYFHASLEKGDCFGEGEIESFITLSKGNKIKKIFGEIVNAKLSKNEQKAEILFKLLILELTEYSKGADGGSAAEMARNIIHKHPERFYKNSELSEKVGISVKGLETKFREKFGLSIHQYMLNFKIEQAKNDLRSYPNMPIREFAFNLGFYDEYHFSKQFKKLTGYSPSEWRKV